MPAQLITPGILAAYLIIAGVALFVLIRIVHEQSTSAGSRNKANNQSEQTAMKLNEEFLALLVHELRAPLTAIIGTTDMVLNEKSLNEKTKEKLLTAMQEEGRHMLKLVNDLLDATKMQAGKFEIEPGKGNLSATIIKSVENYTPQIEQKGLKLEKLIEPDLPEISYDEFRIEQVLNNLLSNAIKYTEQGSITVEARQENGSVLVQIRDTGEGIEEDRLKDLFEKYKNFGKLQTAKKDSTGLGLFISKGIIEAHNGEIRAESEGADKGSTFSFTLPVK